MKRFRTRPRNRYETVSVIRGVQCSLLLIEPSGQSRHPLSKCNLQVCPAMGPPVYTAEAVASWLEDLLKEDDLTMSGSPRFAHGFLRSLPWCRRAAFSECACEVLSRPRFAPCFAALFHTPAFESLWCFCFIPCFIPPFHTVSYPRFIPHQSLL